MDNPFYYTDLRNKIKAYCDCFTITHSHFGRLAGVPAYSIGKFMRGESKTCQPATAELYEAALNQIADTECSVCHLSFNMSHYCLMKDQRDGECIACYRDRIRTAEVVCKQVEAPVEVTVKVKPKPVRILPDDYRIDAHKREVGHSTIAGVAQDKLWFENFFGVTFTPRPPEPIGYDQWPLRTWTNPEPKRRLVPKQVGINIARRNVARRAA